MTGTVTISLQDYHKLVESNDKYNMLLDNTAYSMKELQIFLSFLCNRQEITKYVEEFNRQSKTSKIVIKKGKALIERIDGKTNVRDK
tara:strand:+ start:192 stop:452 length:261 start_codon:yes stop_codon:yes gene_type:complete